MNLGALNSRQRQAVEATEGRIRVIAGAGSGKTKALTYRYAYIVNELGIDPANILCITFTNKAAQEMKSRISQLVPPGYTNDFVCTIHGFCVSFLREEIYRISYPKNFQILDEEDLKALAKHVLTENNMDRSTKPIRELINSLGGLKRDDYIEKYICKDISLEDRNSLSLAVQFLLKEKDKLSLDYDDLIAFTRYILHNYPEVKTKWQERMNYVMLDEAQDCNASEWDIIECLSKLNGNLFVVGDPDQSIYEWRGAKPDVFVSFKSDMDIVLDENYRSTSSILGVANSIIVNNRKRIDKLMFTKKEGGESIIHFHGKDEKQEAEWVCTEIIKRIESGSSYSDFAVLFRSSHLSRYIEQAFIRANIPYIMWGGTRFFERAEIKDCISYLRLVLSDDDLAFERIVNTPPRKAGKATLELISQYAEADSSSMYQALKSHMDNPKLGKKTLQDFIQVIESCRSRRESAPVSSILIYILDKAGLRKEYSDDSDEQRLENITELINSIRLYEAESKEDRVTLEAYLQDIALYTNADYRKETNKVKLMTVHQSKGLEFPYVFIIGLSDGIFPNARSIRERKASALEEERRLMYVAATRAEKCLFMTESEGYNIQARADKLPSRFIAEIKAGLFVTEGEIDEAIWQKLRRQLAVEFIPDDDDLPEDTPISSGIKEGSLVEHKIFGKGTVLSIDDSGSCKVRFDKGIIRFLRQDVLVKVLAIPVAISTDKKHLS